MPSAKQLHWQKFDIYTISRWLFVLWVLLKCHKLVNEILMSESCHYEVVITHSSYSYRIVWLSWCSIWGGGYSKSLNIFFYFSRRTISFWTSMSPLRKKRPSHCWRLHNQSMRRQKCWRNTIQRHFCLSRNWSRCACLRIHISAFVSYLVDKLNNWLSLYLEDCNTNVIWNNVITFIRVSRREFSFLFWSYAWRKHEIHPQMLSPES